VLGASSFGILYLLSRQYLGLIAAAFAFCIPLTYWLMYHWLSGFAFHVPLTWLAFAIPVILMTVVTLLLVAGQSLKVALTNPAESLKQD
ncbi:MAG: cell division protein FtsX, partial [Marivirga sp.]|nr:cell division protein FtsX [Marivirga sp.]